MATIYHNTKNPTVYRITHFTPMAKDCWRWLIMVPCITASGIQRTITGEHVDTGAGLTAWSALPGAPSFDSQDAAIRWAGLMQLSNVVTA